MLTMCRNVRTAARLQLNGSGLYVIMVALCKQGSDHPDCSMNTDTVRLGVLQISLSSKNLLSAWQILCEDSGIILQMSSTSGFIIEYQKFSSKLSHRHSITTISSAPVCISPFFTIDASPPQLRHTGTIISELHTIIFILYLSIFHYFIDDAEKNKTDIH